MSDYDINEIHVTGTVDRFEVVNTKTGTPMIRFTIRCWRERIQVVAFKELATTTMLRPGERAEVRGRIQSTQWEAKDGTRRTGFQIVARSIGPEQSPDSRAHSAPQRHSRQGREYDEHRQRRLPGTSAFHRKTRPGVMDYQGGPF